MSNSHFEVFKTDTTDFARGSPSGAMGLAPDFIKQLGKNDWFPAYDLYFV